MNTTDDTVNQLASQLPHSEEYAPASMPVLERIDRLVAQALGLHDSKTADALRCVARKLTHRTVLDANTCTLYARGSFGALVKIECRSILVEIGPWAQYSEAVKVRLVAKGKRLEKGFTEGFRPFVLVVDGWGHPDPESFLASARPAAVSQYQTDFDAFIAPHLEQNSTRVLLDRRYTKIP